MTTLVKATFIGEDGSLGYENGKEYNLIMVCRRWGNTVTVEKRNDIGGYCPYSNLSTFLKNWTNVQAI